MTWNIWGQEWAVQILKRHIQEGKTRHAYLFTGLTGTGRRTLALQFYSALNCLNPPTVGDFCGECRICKQALNMRHPDLFVGQSEEIGAILKIDTVREIQRALNLKPYDARYRVALFMRFEEANISAQNSLLKTLEEPPECAKLILLASNENALLPTITSRCEIIRLQPMRTRDLANRLSEEKNAEMNVALRMAHLSSGRAGYALKLLSSPDEADRIEGIAAEGLDLLNSDICARFKYAEDFKDTRKRGRLRENIQIWQSLFRDLFLLSLNVDAGEFVDDQITFNALLPRMKDVSEKYSARFFRSAISDAGQMINYIQANGNLQLIAENLFLGWDNE